MPNPEERQLVRWIYEQYQSGMSQEDISAVLMRQGKKRAHSLWYPKTIRRAMAAFEMGFPKEPTPDGKFKSRSKSFRRSRKVGG